MGANWVLNSNSFGGMVSYYAYLGPCTKIEIGGPSAHIKHIFGSFSSVVLKILGSLHKL